MQTAKTMTSNKKRKNKINIFRNGITIIYELSAHTRQEFIDETVFVVAVFAVCRYQVGSVLAMNFHPRFGFSLFLYFVSSAKELSVHYTRITRYARISIRLLRECTTVNCAHNI